MYLERRETPERIFIFFVWELYKEYVLGEEKDPREGMDQL
jgi:hypothetical protein